MILTSFKSMGLPCTKGEHTSIYYWKPVLSFLSKFISNWCVETSSLWSFDKTTVKVTLHNCKETILLQSNQRLWPYPFDKLFWFRYELYITIINMMCWFYIYNSMTTLVELNWARLTELRFLPIWSLRIIKFLIRLA